MKSALYGSRGRFLAFEYFLVYEVLDSNVDAPRCRFLGPLANEIGPG